MVDRFDNRASRRVSPYSQSHKGNQSAARHDQGGVHCRVYVGNLTYDVAWQDLKDFMRSAGEVIRADVLTETIDGKVRSKGCGIVEYSSPEEAQAAIQLLTNKDLKGRPVFVREDREASRITSITAAPMLRTNDISLTRRRVYVGNLAYETAWQDLKDHMRSAGDVVRADVLTNADGRSQGCAIVEYATEQGARNAIASLLDTELQGRLIFVREDREAGPRSSSTGSTATGTGAGAGGAVRNRPPLGSFLGSSNGHSSSGKIALGRRVYVGNLAWDVTWQELKDHMRTAGDVIRADVMTNAEGRSAGYGLVEFDSSVTAGNAISTLNNTLLKGREMHVREDREEEKSHLRK